MNSIAIDSIAKARPANRLLSSRAIQLAVGLAVAVLFPLLYGINIGAEYYASSSTTNSMIGAVVCIVVGFWMTGRLHEFPGVTSVSYTFLSFFVTFGVLVLILFLMRLEYSRVLLMASFFETIIWFVFVKLKVDSETKPRMALVDQGDIGPLLENTSVDWTVISSPNEFRPSMGSVVADLRVDFDDDWLKFLTETALRGVPVYHVKHIREELTGQMSIEHLVENNFGSLLPNLAYLQIKLVIDVVVGLIMLVPAMLILGILAPICLLVQGRPFMFTQTRMGYRGKPFSIYKLRTMTVSPTDGTVERPNSELDIAETAKAQEQRVTGIGWFLRRTRLDELPQILNVVRGEMSWIGPRPEAMELSLWYEDELAFYRYRHIVRPGISGWAQVSQGHVVELEDVTTKLNYDFYYIKNVSMWLDALIAFRTIKTIVTGFGSK